MYPLKILIHYTYMFRQEYEYVLQYSETCKTTKFQMEKVQGIAFKHH